MMYMLDMRQTHLSGVDLNLLVALEALLAEQNVTRAASLVGLSQPAMSRALGRLRDLLDDPILVRAGQSMVPTARALATREPLRRALEAVRRTLEPAAHFDPRTTTRSFALSCLDTTQVVLLPQLIPLLGREAPGLDLVTRPMASPRETLQQLSLGDLDLTIGSFAAPLPGVRSERLYTDRLICLVRRGHPRIRRRLTLERYLSEAHVSGETVSRAELPFTIEAILEALGHERRVACTVANLAMAPFVVSTTDLVCTAVEQSIAPFVSGLGLRALAPPFAVPELEIRLFWHERSENDAGHRWLREALLTLFK